MTLNILLALTRNSDTQWDHTESIKAADAILIDTDVSEGHALLNSIIQEKGIIQEKHPALIAYGENPTEISQDVFFLQKPLRSGGLLPILEQASRIGLNLGSTTSPAERDTPDSVHAPAAESSAKPRRVLDNLVALPDKILGLKEAGHSTYSIIFDRSRRCYYHNGAITDFQQLLLSFSEHFEWNAGIGRDQLADLSAQLTCTELDVPLWRAALAGSEGHMYRSLPLNGVYKLRHWPDLKSLGFTVPHMKLATVLRKGGTIDLLADMTQVSVPETIDFVNACYVVDYLEPVNSTAEARTTTLMPQRAPAKNLTAAKQKKQGLISKIRSRLGI